MEILKKGESKKLECRFISLNLFRSMRFYVVKRRDKAIKKAKTMVGKMLKEYVEHRKIFCRLERTMGYVNRCA